MKRIPVLREFTVHWQRCMSLKYTNICEYMYVIRNRDKSHKGNNNAEKTWGDITQMWGVRESLSEKAASRLESEGNQAEHRATQAEAICWVRFKG